jgi:hypothetical protein
MDAHWSSQIRHDTSLGPNNDICMEYFSAGSQAVQSVHADGCSCPTTCPSSSPRDRSSLVDCPYPSVPGDKKEAIDYFSRILPKIRAEEGKQIEIIDCIQGPGETIFVPGGWWHAVLNLDETMAITQNFMSPHLFDSVWRDFRSSRPKLSTFFLHRLQTTHPDLYKRAIALNCQDKFIMFPQRKTEAEGHSDTTTSFEYSSDSDSSSSSSYHDSDVDLPDESSAESKPGHKMNAKRSRKQSVDSRKSASKSSSSASSSLSRASRGNLSKDERKTQVSRSRSAEKPSRIQPSN